MNKVIAVIRREFIERVRTKAFLISTFGLPIFMVAMMVLPALFMTGPSSTQRIAIVDASSSQLGAAVAEGVVGEQTYDFRVIDARGRVEPVRDSLVALTGFSQKELPGSLNGVLVITDSTYATGHADYYGSNVGSLEGVSNLRGTLSNTLRGVRLRDAGVDQAVLVQAMTPARLNSHKVTDGQLTGESGEASMILAYGMGFLLYFVMLIYGQQTAISVIEEKTSRIMEVLASSLTPFQMLLGKILGVGATGLLQMTIWGGVIFLTASQRGRIAGMFGVDPAMMNALPIPSFPLDLLIIFLSYFVLGFLIYGALYAAVGAIVNSVQDSQQFMMPVMMLIIVGFFGMFAVLKDPNAGIGLAFSFVPFFAPFVMPVRWSMASVPVTQLMLSLAGMVLGVLAVAWLAGRIYRTGILMYGKKPTLREVFRWVRQG